MNQIFFIVLIFFSTISWSNPMVSEEYVTAHSIIELEASEPIYNLFEEGYKIAIRFSFDSDFFNSVLYSQEVSRHNWWQEYTCLVHVSEEGAASIDDSPGRLSSDNFYLFDKFAHDSAYPLSFKGEALEMKLALFKNDGKNFSDQRHGRMTVNDFKKACPDLEVHLVKR